MPHNLAGTSSALASTMHRVFFPIVDGLSTRCCQLKNKRVLLMTNNKSVALQ